MSVEKLFLYSKSEKKPKFVLDRKGFSLLEVMIAMSIGLIVLLGAGQIMQFIAKSQSRVSAKGLAMTDLDLVKMVFGKPGNCVDNFSAPNASTDTISSPTLEIRLNSISYTDPNGLKVDLVTPGKTLLGSAYENKDILVQNFRPLTVDTWIGDLIFSYANTSDNYVSVATPLTFQVDGGGKIMSCGTVTSANPSEFFPGWPNHINCGTLYMISKAGVYTCLQGGASTARSAAIWFDATQMQVGKNNPTKGHCIDSECIGKSIDDLKAGGRAF